MPNFLFQSPWFRRWVLPTESCPALMAALWLIGGILPVLLGLVIGLIPVTVVCGLAATAGFLFFICPPPQRKYAAFLPMGALLTLLHLWAPWQSYREYLPRPECGAEIEGVVTEPLFAAEALPALAPPPTIQLSLTQLRFGPDEPWRPCRGDVILRRFVPKPTAVIDGQGTRDGKKPTAGREASTPASLPSTAPPLPPLYGARIRVSCAFSIPDAPLFPGDFDYALYLRTLGIQHEFLAAAPETSVAPCSGWRRLIAACYNLRDRAVERISTGLEDPATVRLQLLSGIIFNYRAGLTPELRTQFLRSGTIHIFSVGGIHVVILGSILLLVLKLCGVPFRWRHAVLPLLLGLYVVMTGSAPPAVRAWVMISFWAIARGWFFPTCSLNTIAASAIFLLVLNPLQLAQTGFVFSFTLVFFLIYGWEATSRWRGAMLEKDRWRPMSCRPWWSGIYRRLLDLLSGTLLGWCASAGLIAWFNARLIPASFWVNIGIGLTTWCVLALSLVKLLVGWVWSGADFALARLLGWALDATRVLAELGSRTPGSLAISRPSLWSVLLFYAALTVALAILLKPGIRRVAGGVVLCVPVAWLCGTTALRTPQLAVFAGAGAESPAVVLEQPRLPPLVLNTGNFRLSRSLAQWLMCHGHDEADTLILANSDGAKPAELLLGVVAPRRIIQATPAAGPLWSRLRLATAADGTGWHADPEVSVSGPAEARRITVSSVAAATPVLRLTLAHRTWAGTDLLLDTGNGSPTLKLYLPLCEKPLFFTQPL